MTDAIGRDTPGIQTQTPEPENFSDLLTSHGTLIDVRSPAEYASGHFANSVNLPILNDDERRQVGVCYREFGQQKAIVLGHQLVNSDIKQSRVNRWQRAVHEQGAHAIYCWRGGLRSAITQQWLKESDCSLFQVPGGYKSLRRFCLTTLDQATRNKNWLVLGGRTGSGKTEFLKNRSDSIDLEGLAQHRGSAFGRTENPQPSLPTFEHLLTRAYLQHTDNTLLLEDESRTIGRLAIPESWFLLMRQVPVLLLEVDQEVRINNIFQEYVVDPLKRGEHLKTRYLDATDRIRRRLGGERHKQVRVLIEQAFTQESEDHHKQWIGQLLEWYYDPMYDYQLQNKMARVVCRGGVAEVSNHLNNLNNS